VIRNWLRPFTSGRRKARAQTSDVSAASGVSGVSGVSGDAAPAPPGHARDATAEAASIEGWEKISLELYDAEEAEDLREFLAADRLEVRADPYFREQLRKKLWAMVSGEGGEDDESVE